MPKMLLGEKVGMTQVFDEAGNVHGVTVIQLGPCHVLQVKSPEKDGYHALQLGYKEKPKKQANAPETGHAKKAGVAPKRFVREIRFEAAPAEQVGQELTVSLFEGVKAVDIVGTMKGRGFSGVMKRHGFSGLETTHGVQRKHRAPRALWSFAISRPRSQEHSDERPVWQLSENIAKYQGLFDRSRNRHHAGRGPGSWCERRICAGARVQEAAQGYER